MAHSDKNIIITPSIGSTTADPQIVFSGADATLGPQNITLRAYPTSSGTLSFEGSAGQLFSITNSLTGTIFSVNDVSGIPSIEVLDTGTVRLAQYNGNVGIGTATPATKLDITGSGRVSGSWFVLNNGIQTSYGANASGSLISNDSGAPIVFSPNNTERLRIGPAGQIGLSGANYGTTGQVLTSNGNAAAPSWQSPTAVIAVLDDVSGLTDSQNSVYTMRINGSPVINTYITDSKDLQVMVNGRRLEPYTNKADFTFMTEYDAYRGFRVRGNKVIIYNAPERGSQITLIAQPISSTKQIRRYPFSATNIGLGA